MNSRMKWLGYIFLVLGIIFFLENLNVFLLNWSLYIILAGIALFLGFFLNRELSVFLLPATILVIYGALFFYCQVTEWQKLETLWPALLIAPGLGFVLLYILKKDTNKYLFPGGILLLFGLLFFVRKIQYIKYWPVIIIIAGIVLLVRYYIQKSKKAGS